MKGREKFFVLLLNHNDMSKSRDNRKEIVLCGVSLPLLVNFKSDFVVYKEQTIFLVVVSY